MGPRRPTLRRAGEGSPGAGFRRVNAAVRGLAAQTGRHRRRNGFILIGGASAQGGIACRAKVSLTPAGLGIAIAALLAPLRTPWIVWIIYHTRTTSLFIDGISMSARPQSHPVGRPICTLRSHPRAWGSDCTGPCQAVRLELA